MLNKDLILVIGSMNTDMVVRAERLPRPGETVLGGEFMNTQGGKGANQAVAAARLGGNVSFVGKLGNDVFGKQTLSLLKNQNIDTTFISTTDDQPSGVALINVDHNGENFITVASGANNLLSKADIDDAKPAFEHAKFVVMQLETPVETVAYAAQLAKKHGATVILNPAPAPTEPLPDMLLNNIDIIIPNKTEAELITGITLDSDEAHRKALEFLADKGIKTVIFTLGSRGAMVCVNGECIEVPSQKVKAVDTTAAGDTFCGALTVALSEGRDIIDAVKFANQAAAISVTRQGAITSIPTRDELDKAMNTNLKQHNTTDSHETENAHRICC
jgi:ribokinase